MQYEYKLVRKARKDYESVMVNNASQVAKYAIKNKLTPQSEAREKAYLLIVGNDRMTKGYIKISEGGFDSTTIDKKYIMTALLLSGQKNAVLVHSHPNGKCLPSRSDIEETEKLTKYMKAFDCNLLDHVIIGQDGFYSFIEEKISQCD